MYVVTYHGYFGFIKPWTAVRDDLTYSQQFLTPSIIMGIEKKIFPELLSEINYKPRIIRHRLRYRGLSRQQEQTQPKGIKVKKREGLAIRARSIVTRGVMLHPELLLAFASEEDALRSANQHICLCRNEDVMLPERDVLMVNEDEFNKIDGFELHFEKTDMAFLVGYNRYRENEPMYGWLEIAGTPIGSFGE